MSFQIWIEPHVPFVKPAQAFHAVIGDAQRLRQLRSAQLVPERAVGLVDLLLGRLGRSRTGRLHILGVRHQTTISNPAERSEEHTSELQSLIRISYAVFCMNKKIFLTPNTTYQHR